MLEDLRYAARGIVRRPGLTAVVTLVLTIGIAANAIMFGVVDQLLIRPPVGVVAPQQVHRIYFTFTEEGKPGATPVTTYRSVVALRENVPAFSAVAGHFRTTATVGRGVDAEQVAMGIVSGNYFQLLGIKPQRGRAFAEGEDVPPDGAAVAIISDGYWRKHFGASDSVIGKRLDLNTRAFTVVGVAPVGVSSLDREVVDLWVPIASVANENFGEDWYRKANSWWVSIVARVRPDASIRLAEDQATVAYRNEERTWGQPIRDSTMRIALGPIVGTRTPTGIRVEAKVALWLMGVAVIVLLIACANVANLLIARMLQRRREIAVRLALGVSRGRLLRQLLTESALLAVISGAAAIIVARWGGRVVESVLLPGFIWEHGVLDARVLAFTLAATVVCILLAGSAPALQSVRTSVAATLHGSARQIAGGRSRLRNALLVLQAALSVLLLIGAGLFVKSLRHVAGRDVGVALDRVSLVTMNLSRAGFTPIEANQTFEAASERVRNIPGVDGAAVVAASVPMRSGSGISVKLPFGAKRPKLDGGGPYLGVVRGDFFPTIGASVRGGRLFTPDEERVPSRVMMINEMLAKAYWPGRNPVGECVQLGSDSTCTRIVGVVQNVILFAMVKDDRAMVYVPPSHPSFGKKPAAALLVRTRGDASKLTAMIRARLQGMSTRMPYVQVSPFSELVAPQLRPWRLGATMFTLFGVVALVIAAVGLYSVMAYWVSQRTHEIGVRMALGARQTDVVRLVGAQASRPILIGLAFGVVAALVATRWITDLLYETSPRDPFVFIVAAVVLAGAAILASIVPARRSASVDPATALRSE